MPFDAEIKPFAAGLLVIVCNFLGIVDAFLGEKLLTRVFAPAEAALLLSSLFPNGLTFLLVGNAARRFLLFSAAILASSAMVNCKY